MSELNRPMLFMKTGVEGSEPFGFYLALAQTYNADVHSTDAIRIEKSGESIDFSRDMSIAVREESEDRTLASLLAGRNVVYDGFLNTYDRREDMRELAAEAGALAVSLTMIIPLPVAKERIAERFDANILSIPKELSPLDERLMVMERMAVQLQRGGWPHRNTEVSEQTALLDGKKPINQLLTDVADHLKQLRLVHDMNKA